MIGNPCVYSPEWAVVPGVVYLMRCADTGVYKVGGTRDFQHRMNQVRYQAKTRHGRRLVYVWSIITNGVGRLEAAWHREWEQYRVRRSLKEWFVLPDAEAPRFCSFGSVMWKDLPPMSAMLRAALSRPTLPSLALFRPPPAPKPKKKPKGK